jgi:molecular chaperone GrpE
MAKKKKKKKEEILEEEVVLEAEDELEDEDEGELDPEEVVEALDDDDIPVEEKLDLVKMAWDASEAKAAEYMDAKLRAQAEFSNYKKRVNRDREQFQKDAVGRVIRNYLPVLDDLDRALKDKPQNGAGETWAEGIELIYRKMVTLLENDGITPIEAEVGQEFNPNMHEAIARVPGTDHDSDAIIDVMQIGYMIGERVLRPTRVAIAQ